MNGKTGKNRNHENLEFKSLVATKDELSAVKDELKKEIDFLRGRLAVLEHISALTVLSVPSELRNPLIKMFELFDLDTISPHINIA